MRENAFNPWCMLPQTILGKPTSYWTEKRNKSPFHSWQNPVKVKKISPNNPGGRVVRWCWVNFQYQGVLLIWIRVGQEPTALGAVRGCLDIFFSRLSFLFSFSLSLRDGPI